MIIQFNISHLDPHMVIYAYSSHSKNKLKYATLIYNIWPYDGNIRVSCSHHHVYKKITSTLYTHLDQLKQANHIYICKP